MSVDVNKLFDVLGFDPAKKSPNSFVAQEVLYEIKKERTEELKKETKAVFLEAIKLAEEKRKQDRAYQEQNQKFEKSFGKIMNRIDAMMQGKEPEEEKAEEKSEEKKD